MSNDVKYPEIEVQLTGQDGNAYAIIGAVSGAIKRTYGDATPFADRAEAHAAADEYAKQALASESYDALLRHAMRTVTVL